RGGRVRAGFGTLPARSGCSGNPGPGAGLHVRMASPASCDLSPRRPRIGNIAGTGAFRAMRRRQAYHKSGRIKMKTTFTWVASGAFLAMTAVSAQADCAAELARLTEGGAASEGIAKDGSLAPL